MLTDYASLIAAARSAAADPRGAKPTGLRGEDASATLVQGRNANATGGVEEGRCAGTTQMPGADALRLRHNVGVDRRAVALRRKTYAPAHGLWRNAAACPRRTTCSTACLRRSERCRAARARTLRLRACCPARGNTRNSGFAPDRAVARVLNETSPLCCRCRVPERATREHPEDPPSLRRARLVGSHPTTQPRHRSGALREA